MIAEVRSDPFVFRGQVNQAGYEWLNGEDGKPRLVPHKVPGASWHFDEPGAGLFLDFARMSPTKEKIREFANSHGDLFTRFDASESVALKDHTVVFGTSLLRWSREIGDMSVLTKLWEDIQEKRVSELAKIVKRTEKSVGYVLKTPRRQRDVTLAHVDLPGTNFDRFHKDDVLLPARCAFQQEINLRLEESPTVPRLAWTPDYDQRIVFRSPDLLSAMWLQFARAVTGKFQLKMCKNCHKFYQVGPGGRRTDSTTCSDTCRQKDWQRENGKKRIKKRSR